ncbi:MAG: RNA polymerase sigma factor [Chloroflexi bacterium]|nr:MAG: RNA polymerase sigma factor [Chloroflexota bacterium]
MTEEQQAVARLKLGDLAGLEYLVKRYQVKAVHTAYLIVQDRTLAEDLAQQAFINVYRKIDQFDAGRPFGPWFLRSVVNDALKAALREKRLIPIEDNGSSDHACSDEWLHDPSPLPEERMEEEERCQIMRSALLRLPPKQRAAIVLHYYLDFSEGELTGHFNRPLSTIKWWLRDGRQRLKTLLAQTLEEDPKSGGKQ